MCLEQKRSDHPEVSTTPADSPEEVSILIRAGRDKTSIRQDDIGRQKVIDGQAVLSCEVSHAAAQSKPTHSCCRDDSRWHGEAEGVRSVVHVTPRGSAAYADGSCRGVDMHVLDARQIDDETIITNSQPSGVMASSSDRYQQVVFPGEMNGGDDIRNVSAQGDEPRFAADHRVIHFARFVVTRVCGFDQLAAELAFESSNGFLVHRFLPIRERSRIRFLLCNPGRSETVLCKCRSAFYGNSFFKRAGATAIRPEAQTAVRPSGGSNQLRAGN